MQMIGRLDVEMEAATKRMADVLDKLPKEITPVNLEELRRVKQALVELESKADQLRYIHMTTTLHQACRGLRDGSLVLMVGF